VTGAQADVAATVTALRMRQERGLGGDETGLTRDTTFVAAPDFAPPATPSLGSGAATLNALLVLAEVLTPSIPSSSSSSYESRSCQGQGLSPAHSLSPYCFGGLLVVVGWRAQHLSAQEGYSFVESRVVQHGAASGRECAGHPSRGGNTLLTCAFGAFDSHTHTGLMAIVHLGARDRPRVPPADPVPKALALLPLAPLDARCPEQSAPQEEELVAAIDLLLRSLARLCRGACRSLSPRQSGLLLPII
jgi:hypothetical protein